MIQGLQPELQLEPLLRAGLRDILVEELLREGLRTRVEADPLEARGLRPAEEPTWR